MLRSQWRIVFNSILWSKKNSTVPYYWATCQILIINSHTEIFFKKYINQQKITTFAQKNTAKICVFLCFSRTYTQKINIYPYDNWDYKAQHTIGLQAIRAADSIAANLSEGFGRYSPADRKRFYVIARGSFEETKCWMRKAIRRKVLSTKEQSEIADVINLLGPKLNLFIKNQNIQKWK